MLEKYLSSNQDSNKKDEALYLKAIMQGLVQTDKNLVFSQNEIKKIKQHVSKLKEKNEKLVLENKKLNDTIEKLKLLDLQLEEKRLKF
jgi:regulator of replication initiation timing